MDFYLKFNPSPYDYLFQPQQQEQIECNNKTLNIIFIFSCLMLIHKSILNKLKK